MIRQATIDDFDAIIHIQKTLALELDAFPDKDYKVRVQRNGFLMPVELAFEAFKKDVEKIYLVAQIEEKVVGYLRVDEEQEMEKETKVHWFHPDLKDIYFSKPHADIGGIAVLPTIKQHGIATDMLLEAERKVRAKGLQYIFSFVALSPITNFPSMMFHEKNGFERIATSEPHFLFGMNNYQSILYGKKLFH